MDDIVGIIKSLKGSGVLIDEVSETVKHEIKNTKVYSLAFRNFRCFNVRKYLNWKMSRKSRNRV